MVFFKLIIQSPNKIALIFVRNGCGNNKNAYHQPRGMWNYFNSVRLKNLYNKNENNPHATKQTKNNKDKV